MNFAKDQMSRLRICDSPLRRLPKTWRIRCKYTNWFALLRRRSTAWCEHSNTGNWIAMEWNDSRVAELTQMWREGFSASQVARQLGGVSRSAVIGKIHRLGVSARSGPSRPRASGGRPQAVARPRSRPSPSGERRWVAPSAPRPSPVETFEAFATVTVLTLTETSCRWPIGHPDQAEFGFCGQARAGKSPYCQGHGPLGVLGRDVGMKHREIERIVRRFVEAPPPWSSQEMASEAAQTLAVAR